MPKPIPDEGGLDMAALQEAVRRESFGEIGEEQEPLAPGEDLTDQGVEEPAEPVQEPEPQPEPEPEPVQEPVEEPKQKVLTEEELDNLVVKAKVNGKEVEYTWKQLRDIKQTQDAAEEFLERAKREFKEERDAYRKQHEQREQPREDEYLTEEEKRVRALEDELRDLRQHQQSFEESSLTESEERHMRTVFERDGLSEEDAATRLKQIVDAYPDAAEFARDLFTTNPSSKEDLNKRIKTFNTLWQLGKTIEMPEVIQKTAEIAEQRGRTEAKKDAKRQLADTPSGHADMREPSQADRLRELAKRGDDHDWAKFMLDNSVVIKEFE